MNIGFELSRVATQMPDAIAVVEPDLRGVRKINDVSDIKYQTVTFRELDEDSNRIAAGLADFGIQPGMRLALLVPPGIDFVSLVFALFKAGVVTVLIDPGMGRDNLIRCLQETEPNGFVTIPKVHVARLLKRKLFAKARFNVTVGRRWFWGGKTLKQLRSTSHHGRTRTDSKASDQAAIIFTTGSTGPPKGVLYRHGNFVHQVRQIRDRYNIQPGEIDLPGFPLFALFNTAMGVTTVFPHMDFTRPAEVNADLFRRHAIDWSPTQSFGSPALWNKVGHYCEETGNRFDSVCRILSAGAPVPPHVLKRIKSAVAKDAEIHTPYGATEALPVATISAQEVLSDTAALSAQGAGTCVGRRFSGIDWRVIHITDEPIESIADTLEMPRGSIGELIVKGPVVTTEYVTQTDANALAKIRDGDNVWHRMGDCGYLDSQERFWFCGRKSHRVITEFETLFTVPCEAIANEHPRVYRSALVGLGVGKTKVAAMLVETWPNARPSGSEDTERLLNEIHRLLSLSPKTSEIRRSHVLWHPGFPVDIRHNAKIFREKLAPWAESMTPQR